jgi:uncharacterized membrane protein
MIKLSILCDNMMLSLSDRNAHKGVFSFMCMFCRSLFVLLSRFFFFATVLSVLFRFTDSDYAFGIFKLFLYMPDGEEP